MTIPDVISHKALICALADESRRDIPRETPDYLFPLLHELLAMHWNVEPPTEEERRGVLNLLSFAGH